ncbi:MAG: hypothetical protein ACTHLZ_17820 [Tepidisphaeraceae bacterium]
MSQAVATTRKSSIPETEIVEQSHCPDCHGRIANEDTATTYPGVRKGGYPTRQKKVYCEHCDKTFVQSQKLSGAAWQVQGTERVLGRSL